LLFEFPRAFNASTDHHAGASQSFTRTAPRQIVVERVPHRTGRRQSEPNIDDLLRIVNESVEAYAVCKRRIDAVEKALEKTLAASGVGAGYHAPQETAAALQALRPHMSSEGQAFFENLGRTSAPTGGQITKEQLQQGMGHLQSAARARDEQEAPKGPNTTSAPAA
jgi:hypothetical protein